MEPRRLRNYSLGGTLVALHAQETIRRQLACELGPQGVRVVTIVTGVMTIPPSQGIINATMIGRAATRDDVASVAVFVASDAARMMTAATVNISGGALID